MVVPFPVRASNSLEALFDWVRKLAHWKLISRNHVQTAGRLAPGITQAPKLIQNPYNNQIRPCNLNVFYSEAP